MLCAGDCSVLASQPAVYFSKECKLSKAVGLDASVTVGGARLPLNDAVSAAVGAAAPAAAAVRTKPAVVHLHLSYGSSNVYPETVVSFACGLASTDTGDIQQLLGLAN